MQSFNKMNGYTLYELIFFIVVALGLIGWIMNISKVVSALSCPITVETVLRIISIFVFPVGAILGYFPYGSGC